MNRYSGNTGRVERIPEPVFVPAQAHTPPSDIAEENFPTHHNSGGSRSGSSGQLAAPRHAQGRFTAPAYIERPSGHGSGSPFQGIPFLSGLLGGDRAGSSPLGGLLSRFTSRNFELEDYLLIGILYLLYRESGDIEFLLIAGAMLIL